MAFPQEHNNQKTYNRELLSKKIHEDTVKSRKLVQQREELRAQRVEANMKAARDRQSMMIQMDTLRHSGKL